MKLRIKGNSIRLRLGRSETEMLARGETVTETTQFGGGAEFVYSLRPDGTQVAARYAGGRIEVDIPRQTAEQWALSTDDTISGEQTADGVTLAISIEKDYACLTRRDEDSDSFPHPREQDC